MKTEDQIRKSLAEAEIALPLADDDWKEAYTAGFIVGLSFVLDDYKED